MAFITRLSKLFAKKQSEHIIGISIRQNSIALCQHFSAVDSLFSEHSTSDSLDENELEKSQCYTVPVEPINFVNTLSTLQEQYELNGECHLVLPSHLTQIVQIEKPSVPANEINGALKWQLKDLVTIPPDNLLVDYFDGPDVPNANNKINVVCSPLNELKEIVAAINAEGLLLKSIVTEEFAFARLLPTKNEATLFVCQQSGEEIIVLIVKQGRLFFNRRLRGFSQIKNQTEHELMMGAIDSLSLEIQRSTDYFERQLKQAPIKEILLLLPIENEKFLAHKLAENTNVPVSLYNFPEGCDNKRDFACAIGATIQDVFEVKS